MPSAAELKRAEEVHPGSAKTLLDAYLASLSKYEDRLDKAIAMQDEAQQHAQSYRLVSVSAGVFLGTAALGETAYAVHQNMEVGPLGWVLGSVAGLAGVFAYGRRPSLPTHARHRVGPTAGTPESPTVAGTPESR